MVKQIYFKHRKAAPAIFNNALVENYKENFDAGQISVEKKRCYNPVEITGWKFHGKYSYGSFSRPIKRADESGCKFLAKEISNTFAFCPWRRIQPYLRCFRVLCILPALHLRQFHYSFGRNVVRPISTGRLRALLRSRVISLGRTLEHWLGIALNT